MKGQDWDFDLETLLASNLKVESEITSLVRMPSGLEQCRPVAFDRLFVPDYHVLLTRRI